MADVKQVAAKQANYAVMVCRNNRHLSERALESLRAQDVRNLQVLVLDNASTDGTAEWADSQLDITVSHSYQQRSVAGSWNFLLDHLFDICRAPHVLVINNDVELRPDTYRLLVSSGHLFATGVGVSSKRQIEDPIELKDRPNPDFSCFLIRREVWDLGLRFNEIYEGAYCEDAEFHLDMHRAGIKAYCIGVPFYHVASGTLKHSDEQEQARIIAHADVNRKRFRERHGVEVGSPAYYALFESASE